MRLGPILGLVFFGAFLGLVHAQPETKKEPPKKAAPVEPETKTEVKATSGNAFLLMCDEQPSRVILLDSNGRWISTVKAVEIKFDLGGVNSITCVMYEGLLKPSTPQTKTWVLNQVKSVPAVEFQKMIDSLQTDPEAIKTALKRD